MYSIKKTPVCGAKAIYRIFIILISFIFFNQVCDAQNFTIECNTVNTMTPASCSGEFIVNGNFSDILNEVNSLGEIPNANWWNSSNYAGPWNCINPSSSGSYADLFSGSMGSFGWTDGINNYSNGVFVADPTGDGNYAAFNVYEDPYTGGVDLTYIEQELANYLYPGSTYELSFSVRRAEVSSYTSEIGVYLTPDIVVSQPLESTDPPNAMELSLPLPTDYNWHTLTFQFTVSGSLPLKYITIGKKNDASVQQLGNVQYPPSSGHYVGHYFIDGVSLILQNQSNLSFNLTYCNPSGYINLQAANPNSIGSWALISGNGNLVNSSSTEVDLNYTVAGNYTVVYSYLYNNCDGSSSLYQETFNITIDNAQNIQYEDLVVCEGQVDISGYQYGLDGDWSIITGDGNISLPFYSDYEVGTSILLFTPTPGQEPCQMDELYLTIEYVSYPKSTHANNFDIWNDIVNDYQGNIYVVGTYTEETSIDGNLISNGLGTNNTKEQFMVAKYDPCGELVWLTWGLAHCTDQGITTGTSIAIDEQYNRIYISGQSYGMLMQYLDGGIWNAIDLTTSPNISLDCDDSNPEPYILELNSQTGHFEDFLIHLGGDITINSLAVATDGPFNHFLYAAGEFATNANKNSFLMKFETNSNFSANNNLIQSNTLSGISTFNNSINDIVYKNQKVYAIGTTEGSFYLPPKQINVNLNNGSSTAWVALIKDNVGGFSADQIGHGGGNDPFYSPYPRIMTGDNIYVNTHNQIIISGLYSQYVYQPFSFSNNYYSTSSGAPTGKDLYIFKLFPAGPNIVLQMDPNNADFVITPQGFDDISEVAMCGNKDDVYLSATYTGKKLFFQADYDELDVTAIPDVNNGEKIMIAHYDSYPTLSKEWYNTTLDMEPGGEQNAMANCAFNDKVYTVGNYMEKLNFSYDNYSPIEEFESDEPIFSGFIFRNDNSLLGGFKSLSDTGKKMSQNIDDIRIYPNPSSGIITITGDIDFNDIIVSDLSGRRIPYTKSVEFDKVILNFEAFKGLALVKIQAKTYRIIIQ